MTTDWDEDRAEFIADVVTERGAMVAGPLAQEFAQLTRALLSADTVAGVLEEIVHAAKAILPGADVVSVTLRAPDGSFHTPVETDPLATALDQVQYTTGEGPCVACARLSGPALAYSPDLTVDQLWPEFSPAVVRMGMGSILSTALLPSAQPPQLSGALNIYSRERKGLDTADHTVALLLATHASLALAHTDAVSRADLQAAHLRKAIDSRDVIGQAKGILMGRRGVSADEAFALLRKMSQEMNVKLAELAKTVADRHAELNLSTSD